MNANLPPEPAFTNALSKDLEEIVLRLLGNHLQQFRIDTSDEGIVMSGSCDSYYAKQMAQEIVLKNTSQRIAANHLVVNDLSRHEPAAEQPNRFDIKDSSGVTEFDFVSLPHRFEIVFHPSDFSPASDIAFAHALKIALMSQTTLEVMHVDMSEQTDWDDFPNARETLERWKVLPKGSGKGDVIELGLEITKVIASSDDPVKACLDYLDDCQVDLIVLSVHQREGMMRWLGKMVGERISYDSKQSTLFIPVGRQGFVSSIDGSVTLKSILVPVVKKPRAEESVRFVVELIHNLRIAAGTVTLLHVGEADTIPFVQHPLDNGWTWKRVRLDGDRTETIVQYAKDIDADLIVMTTDGPDRFLDGLRGTTSERVLRKAHCPVAVIPVGRIEE